MGIAQNLKKENVIAAEEADQRRCKQGWASDMPGTHCWEFEDDSKVPWPQVILQHVIRQIEGNTNCRSLERVAHAGRFLESAGQFQIYVQRFQGNCTRYAPLWLIYALLQDRMEGSFIENELNGRTD